MKKKHSGWQFCLYEMTRANTFGKADSEYRLDWMWLGWRELDIGQKDLAGSGEAFME